jgi:hypothetical protein
VFNPYDTNHKPQMEMSHIKSYLLPTDYCVTYCDIKQDMQHTNKCQTRTSVTNTQFLYLLLQYRYMNAAIKAIITYKTTDAYTNSYQFWQSEAITKVWWKESSQYKRK